MAKLYEVTGEKKPTGIHTHQKLTTVNENVKVPPKPQVSNGDIPPKEEVIRAPPSYQEPNLNTPMAVPSASPRPSSRERSPRPSSRERRTNNNSVSPAPPPRASDGFDF